MSPQTVLALGTALAAVGIWWILPGSGRSAGGTGRRAVGAVLSLIGFGLLASQTPVVGDWFSGGMFRGMGAVTVIAALATISFRNPVYCAIWFGMTLAGTAGLFLLAGAEFLAVATVVVYAGAILVTFLFVLMLSQPDGHASYDRHSWEARTSAFTGAILLGILTSMIGASITHAEAAETAKTEEAAKAAWAVQDAVPAANAVSPLVPSLSPTVSNLGAVLFTQYLVATEAVGALLFAALVGAAVIVSQGRAAMKRPSAAKGAAHVS